MGFDHESLTSKDIRNENYYESIPRHEGQETETLVALGVLKRAGATAIYNHIITKKHGGREAFPKSSIRRALNTLVKKGRVISDGNTQGQFGTETAFIIYTGELNFQ